MIIRANSQHSLAGILTRDTLTLELIRREAFKNEEVKNLNLPNINSQEIIESWVKKAKNDFDHRTFEKLF